MLCRRSELKPGFDAALGDALTRSAADAEPTADGPAADEGNAGPDMSWDSDDGQLNLFEPVGIPA